MSALYNVQFRTRRHRLITEMYLIADSAEHARAELRRRTRIEADIAPSACPVHEATARKIPPQYRNRLLTAGESFTVNSLILS